MIEKGCKSYSLIQFDQNIINPSKASNPTILTFINFYPEDTEINPTRLLDYKSDII